MTGATTGAPAAGGAPAAERGTPWRRALNLLNLSTPAGLLLARLGGAEVVAHRGLLIAGGHRPPWRHTGALTVGDVVLVREPAADVIAADALDPRLLDHEARHAAQYAWCLGPALWPLYGLAAGWSWARTGDWWSRNAFEVRAGLADGGYTAAPPRSLTR